MNNFITTTLACLLLTTTLVFAAEEHRGNEQRVMTPQGNHEIVTPKGESRGTVAQTRIHHKGERFLIPGSSLEYTCSNPLEPRYILYCID